jgi:hypothetical protein
MNAGRSIGCALLAIAALMNGGRAGAVVEEGAVVTLHVVASSAEARATREVLAELLSRIGIGFADGAGTTPLADVEIDLSAAHGGPSVTLSTREPAGLLCRRFLSSHASREVLIESAAEVAYAAVESRARALGVVRDEVAPASPPTPKNGPPPAAQTEIAAADTAAPVLRTQAISDAARPGYGVDAAAFAEMQVRAAGPRPTAGGGAAVTFGLRAVRLDPALTLGLSYLRAVGAEDPAAPANISMVSTRIGATVDALAFRWFSVQLGPSLSLDFVRGDAPTFMPGPGPGLMPMPGATQSFSGLAIWAGGDARVSVRVTQSAHVFLAAGAGYQLRQGGPARKGGAGPPNGAVGVPAQWMDEGVSGWRSSLVVGLAFTLAGRPLMAH